jgi:hypothetical protein
VGDGIYELALGGDDCRLAKCERELTVTAYDVDGNARQVTRKFTHSEQGTVPPVPTATPGATPLVVPFPVPASTPTVSSP